MRHSYTGLCAVGVLWCVAANGLVNMPVFRIGDVRDAPGSVELVDGSMPPKTLVLDRKWAGTFCTSTLTNNGTAAVAVKRVVLFRFAHRLPPETGLYGEGFTMLSQTGGTLGKPADIGGYTDAGHYKIPQPADATTVYELLVLSPPGEGHILLGFTSCRRFVGAFHLRPDSVEVALDTEGLELEAGETWNLEEFAALMDADRTSMLNVFADRINQNHPRLRFDPVPTGWCSWYCYGPAVKASQVTANLEAIREHGLPLTYIQIDDGYQSAMGDWLDTGKAFGGGIREVLDTIRKGSCEPAIWVAPFIAEENSNIFKEHPDWFIEDETGQPLRSDRVTFGGWRRGPWYALDGTNPAVQQHLESVFRTMRREWGCTYFKLDANFWGAMHGGRFHDAKATRVEAYRRGMEAVLRGAGDGFILGCNHPLWPSLGVIHGGRSSNDTGRSWESFRNTARETFNRNWQNGRLWWNDPDCVLLTGKLPDKEFQFHATAIYAAGGMTLSGDDLTRIPPERLDMLRKLVPPTGVAAQFEDNTFRAGAIDLPDSRQVCVFNWDETPQTVSFRLPQPADITDFWTGERLGEYQDIFEVKEMRPRSARLFVCKPAAPRPAASTRSGRAFRLEQQAILSIRVQNR